MKIGIICAIPEEYEPLTKLLDKVKVRKEWQWEVHEGLFCGIQAVLIMSGIAKVNSALAVSLLKIKYSVDIIISAGLAGILDPALTIGDIVIGKEAVYHDCLRPVKLPADPIVNTAVAMCQPISTEASLVSKAAEVLNKKQPVKADLIATKTGTKKSAVTTGRIATGDLPVTSEETANKIREELGAACVDMEAAGIAQACSAMNIPYLPVRIMSDYTNQHTYIYILRYGKSLGVSLAQAVAKILENMVAAPQAVVVPRK